MVFFNFRASFLNWIDTFVSDSTVCVGNNGYLTGFFFQFREAYDGAVLSALNVSYCMLKFYRFTPTIVCKNFREIVMEEDKK